MEGSGRTFFELDFSGFCLAPCAGWVLLLQHLIQLLINLLQLLPIPGINPLQNPDLLLGLGH